MVIKERTIFLYLSGGETQAGSTVKAIIKYESDKETWEIKQKPKQSGRSFAVGNGEG